MTRWGLRFRLVRTAALLRVPGWLSPSRSSYSGSAGSAGSGAATCRVPGNSCEAAGLRKLRLGCAAVRGQPAPVLPAPVQALLPVRQGVSGVLRHGKPAPDWDWVPAVGCVVRRAAVPALPDAVPFPAGSGSTAHHGSYHSDPFHTSSGYSVASPSRRRSVGSAGTWSTTKGERAKPILRTNEYAARKRS